MNNKIISIDTLKYYNDKISNYIDEKVSDTVDNLELDELNAILVDTDAEADDPIVPDYVTENELATALQSYTEQYKGTVTKVKINGSEKSPDSDGVVDLGKIEGGGSNNGTKEIVVLESEFSPGGNELEIIDFEPNKIYICNEALSAIYFDGFVTNDSLNNEYILHFKAGEYGCAIYTQNSWLWPNGEIPYIVNCYCELSIVTTYIGDEYIYKCVLTQFKSLV